MNINYKEQEEKLPVKVKYVMVNIDQVKEELEKEKGNVSFLAWTIIILVTIIASYLIVRL